MIRLLRLRRLVQVAVLLLLAALPWLNRDGFTGMKGSLCLLYTSPSPRDA